MKGWKDGHAHAWVYFGGMASCNLCAAQLSPNGKVSAPSKASRQHRQMAELSRVNKTRSKRRR